MLNKQFIGKTTWRVLVGVALMHILAFFGRGTLFEWPLLILVGIIAFIIAWKSLHSGLLIAFTEIFVGGHGHLLDVELFGFSISLRIIIFSAVMLAWVILSLPPIMGGLKEGRKIRFELYRDVPWLVLALAVTIGFLIGYLNNGFGPSFDDMNGYLMIGYLLPLISVTWDNNKRLDLLQMLAGCLIWISGFTIFLAFLFTHLDGDSLHILYTFVRDSRLAEITLQVVDNKGGLLNVVLTKLHLMQEGDYWYRIFMPAQAVLLAGVSLIISASLFMWRGSRKSELVWLVFIILMTALFLSLSRSFILGLAVSAVGIFIVSWFFGKKKLSTIPRRTIGLAISGLVAMFVIWSVVMIPIPTRPDLLDAAFFQTSANTGRVEAVVSRWNLLDALMIKISEHPILGSGFGTAISYNSEDPRIISELGGAEYSTYRLEWGWHDIWLKMGLLGLLAFILYFSTIMYIGWQTVKNHSFKWLVVGLLGGLLAIFVAHTFSPYLNHPIGLGYMLFVIPFLDFNTKFKKIELKLKKPELLSNATKQPTTVTVARR